MALGDAVDVAAEIERELRHVELVGAAELADVDAGELVAHELLDEVVGEDVMPGGDRRVRGEVAERADARDVAGGCAPVALAQELKGEQRGMSLVEVEFADAEAERLQHAQPADAEDDF